MATFMKRYLYFCLTAGAIGFTACTASPGPRAPAPPLKTVIVNDSANIIAGETVYVPVYSYIYTVDRNRTWELTATLSTRNTDLVHPIILSSVKYFDSSGTLIRNYLEQPVELGPLAATDFVIDQRDTSGGVGSAFIVEWVAQATVSAPVIEAVMINTVGNQGLSFVSNGRVIKRR